MRLRQPELKDIQLFAIGREGEMQSWSAFLGPMYEAVIIVQLTFDNGITGIAGTTMWTEHEFDHTTFQSAALTAHFLKGRGLYDWPQILDEMKRKYIPMKNYAISLYDIAWHDAKAKSSNIPLYQMLGTANHKIRAYASSPVFDHSDQYIEYCQQQLDKNFGAIKIHARGIFEEDVEIVRAIQSSFSGTGLAFNLDADANYSFQQALKMARLLDEYEWDFFEEPMPDSDFDAYQRLSAKVGIDIVNGGNSVTDFHLLKHAINKQCWGRLRFDINSFGGYQMASRLMGLAHANRIKVELQCWGNTISQASNLHLMLAHSNCEFFELVTPYEKYEFGCRNGFRPDSDGFIHPGSLPGLGVELDWDMLDPFVYLHRSF